MLPSAWSKIDDILDDEGDIGMPSKKHRPEEIIGKLREAEVVLAQGGM